MSDKTDDSYITIYDLYKNNIEYYIYGDYGPNRLEGYSKIEEVEDSVRNSLLYNINAEETQYINNKIYLAIKIMIPVTAMFTVGFVLYWVYS
jgi:hypothetical protein